LLRGVGIGALSSHEVQESVEVNVSAAVRIDCSQNSLEIDISLPVFSDRISEGNETRFELFRCETTGPVLIEVIERRPELVELLLRDAFGVAGEDLILHFVDVAIDGGQQLFPTDAQSFHCVLGVSETTHSQNEHPSTLLSVLPVFKDHAFLYGLVDLLELLDVRLVSVHALFVFFEAVQLVFESTVESHTDRGDGVQLTFDPRTDCVRFFGELASEHFVILLLPELALQSGVSLRHQLPHLAPFSGEVLQSKITFLLGPPGYKVDKQPTFYLKVTTNSFL
jgi:hypothetical protein